MLKSAKTLHVEKKKTKTTQQTKTTVAAKLQLHFIVVNVQLLLVIVIHLKQFTLSFLVWKFSSVRKQNITLQ